MTKRYIWTGTAIGFRADCTHHTAIGRPVYRVFVAMNNGRIEGPFRASGEDLHLFGISRGDTYGGRWIVEFGVRGARRIEPIIMHVEKEGGEQ